MSFSINEPPILFIHIPKTAGTTVRNVLEYGFRENEVLRIEDPATIPVTGIAQNLRFVSGHVPPWYQQFFATAPTIITVLRNPLARIASAYGFFRSLKVDDAFLDTHPEVRLALSLSFEDFALCTEPALHGEVNNYQTQFLGNTKQRHRFHNEQVFAQAKETLLAARWFGLVEHMAPSIALLARAFNLPPQTSAVRVNATPSDSKPSELSTAARSRVFANNAYDLELYRFAENLLAQRVRDAARTISLWRKPYEAAPTSQFGRRKQLDFADGIIGTGWWPRETNGFSWGYAFRHAIARVYAWWPGHDHQIMVVAIPNVQKTFLLSDLKIAINGSILRSLIVAGLRGHYAVLRVPPSLMSTDTLTEIAFVSCVPDGLDDTIDFTHTAQTSFAIRDISWLVANADDMAPAGAFTQALAARGINKHSRERIVDLLAAVPIVLGHVPAVSDKEDLVCDTFVYKAPDERRAAVVNETQTYLPPVPLVLHGLGIDAAALDQDKVVVSACYLTFLLNRLTKAAPVDEGFYTKLYPDVHAALQAGAIATAANHFTSSGAAECRLGAPVGFDPVFYYDHYKDLAARFAADDHDALWRHYYSQGYREGRAANAAQLAEAQAWRAGIDPAAPSPHVKTS